MPSADGPNDFPDLEAAGPGDFEIVADNIRSLQPVYFSAMLEELKVFQVVDKLVELFQSGALPIGIGDARDNLARYSQGAANRISEAERRSLYARTLGLVGGEDGGTPNREFNDLWLRFVSAVSSFVRQSNENDLSSANVPDALTQQQVTRAGRDLAANLSLHGGGAVKK